MTVVDSRSQNHAVETLRALAVILVFVNHLQALGVIAIPYFGANGGWLGVQIFFVISGYLIIQSARKYSLLDYAKHRFFRIYPAYIFWFFAFSVIVGSFKDGSFDFWSLLAHLLFLQHFFPAAYLKYNALGVSWTLTVEMVWYVVAFVGVAKFFQAPSKVVFGFVVAACFWVYKGMNWHPFIKGMEDIYVYFFIRNNVIAQLPFFAFGAWIAVKEPKYDKAALLSIFVSTVILFKSWEPIFLTPIFITGLGVSALFLILKDSEYKNPKAIKFFSDISYSFYLVHYPVLLLVSQHLSNKYHQLLVALAVSAILSYASYVVIERPFIAMARKKA